MPEGNLVHYSNTLNVLVGIRNNQVRPDVWGPDRQTLFTHQIVVPIVVCVTRGGGSREAPPWVLCPEIYFEAIQLFRFFIVSTAAGPINQNLLLFPRLLVCQNFAPCPVRPILYIQNDEVDSLVNNDTESPV